MLLGWAAFVSLIAGCSESPDRSAQKQASESVVIADKLIRESQFGAAGVAFRPDDDLSDFEQALNEWDQLAQRLSPGDFQALQRAADQMYALSLQILDQQRQSDAPSIQTRNQRLQEAQQTLSEAISKAQQNEVREARVGPELMLGTMYLMDSRDKADQLKQQAAQVHSAQASLSSLLSALVREQLVGFALENRRSPESIEKLNALLDEPDKGLRSRLAEAEAKTQKVLAERNSLQKQYETVQDQADRLLREYVDLLNQAEQASGQQRYQLQLKAYEIRRGKGQGPDKVEGAIALEARAQKVQNELAVLDTNVQYQLLLQGKLRENIQQIEDTIKLLQNPTFLKEIQDGLWESDQQTDQLVSLASKQLSALRAADEQYIALREEAVEAFSETLNSFNRAAGAAVSPDLRNTRQHAQHLAQLATREWAQLWQSDALHYDLSQTILASVEQVAPLREEAGPMRLAYEQARDQAQAHAAQLLQQIQEVEADVTVPPMTFDEPGGIDPGVVDTAEVDLNAVDKSSLTTPPPVITDPNQIIR